MAVDFIELFLRGVDIGQRGVDFPTRCDESIRARADVDIGFELQFLDLAHYHHVEVIDPHGGLRGVQDSPGLESD